MKKFLLSVLIFILTLSFTATDITFAKEKLTKAQKQAQLEAKKKARAEERAKKKAEREAKRKARQEELAQKKAERKAKRAQKKAERKAKREAKKAKLAKKKTTGKAPLWLPLQGPDRYLNSARSCLNKKKFASARTGAAYVANNCSIVEKQIEATVLLEQIDQSETAYMANKEAAAKAKREARLKRKPKRSADYCSNHSTNHELHPAHHSQIYEKSSQCPLDYSGTPLERSGIIGQIWRNRLWISPHSNHSFKPELY